MYFRCGFHLTQAVDRASRTIASNAMRDRYQRLFRTIHEIPDVAQVQAFYFLNKIKPNSHFVYKKVESAIAQLQRLSREGLSSRAAATAEWFLRSSTLPLWCGAMRRNQAMFRSNSHQESKNHLL